MSSERRDPPKPPAPSRTRPTVDTLSQQLPRLPLGAEAFVSPLHAPPTPSAEQRPLSRRRSLGLLAAISLASGAAALAAWTLQDRSEVPFAQQDHGSLRVMPGARLPATSHTDEPLLKAAISMRLPSLLGRERDRDDPQPSAAEPAPAAEPVGRVDPVGTIGKGASPREERSMSRGSRARRASAKPATRGKLPELPERSAVIAAMKRITPAVERCFGAAHGVAKVTLFVRGPTGKVSLARVSGLTGKPGSCIATVMRRVSLPPFQRTQLEISYPFSH